MSLEMDNQRWRRDRRRAVRRHVKHFVIFVAASTVVLASVFGIQAAQVAQAASAQAHSQQVAEAKLAAAIADQKLRAARAEIDDAVKASDSVLATATSGNVNPYKLTDAIFDGQQLLLMQSEDPAEMSAAAHRITDAQSWLAEEIVKHDADQVAAAQKTAEDAAKKAAKPTPPTVHRAPATTVQPKHSDETQAHFLTRAQAVLNRLGGGVTVSFDSTFDFHSDHCSAHASLGEPHVYLTRCYPGLPDELMYGMMAHEWVHTQTNLYAVLPDALAPAGIKAAEMIAECYAMARLGTVKSPGGYMANCTPEQTAASIAVIENPTYAFTPGG